MKYVYCFVAAASTLGALGQGTFRNLDFELANLPILAPGQYMIVSDADALPGWTAYLGTDLQTTILYNAQTLGDASVSILGPNYQAGPTLQGDFMAFLAAGRGHSITSLRQTGVVPNDAQSLRVVIASDPTENFEFSLNGVALSMVPLAVGPSATLYGADVSTFAGQSSLLNISAYLSPSAPTFFGFRLDDIRFSNQPIPEPSVFGLLALSAFLLGWRFLWRHKNTT